MKPTFYYEKSGTRKVFHKFNLHSDNIRNAIEETIEKELATNFSKTKLASHIPYRGHKIYECRVNVGKLPAFRVAFTIYNNSVDIVFITNQIQKSSFSKALNALLKEA